MERIFCLLIGYVCGLFQTAYIYGKLHGIDIREHGSGNAGTTNTLRVLGRKAGIIVLLGDILKTAAAIWICELLFAGSHPEMLYLLKLYAVAGAILGHNFPCYLQFKGGKGIAATAGFIIFFHPYFIPVGLVLFFSIFFITHYVSLGSLMIYVGIVVEMIVCGQLGVFGMSQSLLNEMYVITVLLAVMAFVKHRTNIQRLLSGTERKTYLSKKNRENA